MTKPDPFANNISGANTVTILGTESLSASPLAATDDRVLALATGEVIQDVFKVERFLASGGMGQVFQARDLRLERAVAVKVLHGQFHETDGLNRFQREARSLSRVVHPNVVATYEVGFHQGSPFLVMEYVDGPTLGTHIRTQGKLEVADALRLTTQIGAGLEEAHALGIVHRDVKPGNILLHRLRSGGLLAKVVDFGLAVALDSSETALGLQGGKRAHDIAGSPLYMSPEQIRGEELTGASDQYSLAIVLYEMLTGRPPFVGDSLKAIFDRHLEAPVPALGLPAGTTDAQALQTIIMRAMSKKSDDRYRSVSEFMSALKELLGEGSASSGESTACDVCGSRIHSGHSFCRGCGTPVPMKSCMVCGAERIGKRSHCIQCSASLLARPGYRRVAAFDLDSIDLPEREQITTYGVMACMEVVSGSSVVTDWNWMVEQFRTSVEREHGHTVAILGTEALAYFGMGGLREREVERAVDSALYVMDLVKRRLEGQPNANNVQVRIAVELGGVDAEGTGMSWGTARATGPCVQAVRRMVRQPLDSGVFVGPNVWREIRSLYESVVSSDARRVTSRRRVAILREPSTIAGIPVPLVGRAYETEHLERAFRRIVTHGRLVTVPVIGPPGIGKSRLLSEFLNLLNSRSERCEVDVSRCIPSGEGVPFAPFRNSFRNRYRLDGQEDVQTISSLLRHLPGMRKLPDRVGAQRVHHLMTLLGFDNTVPNGVQKERWTSPSDPTQELAFEAYCEYIRAMAADAPYVLALDDLQWMRPSTAKLLSYLAAHCEDRPILIILTVRQKDASQWLGNLNLSVASVSSVELGPLSRRDVGTLAAQVFGDGVLDDTLLDTLYNLSNGSPQELEGHLDALVEGQIIHKTESGWIYTPQAEPENSTLPQSLRELIQQRLVRLGSEEQRILRAAALAGPSVSIGLLSAMVDRQIDDRELDALVSDGWLLESDIGDFPRSREVSFRQDSIRDAILGMLSEEASQQLHERAVNWLSRGESAIHPSARTGRLAKHYSASGNYREAARYTLQKAREFDAGFAGPEAFSAYGEVIDLLTSRGANPTSVVDIDWYVEAGLGRAYHAWVLGKLEAAVHALDALGSCLDRVQRPLSWCRQQFLYGEVAYVEGRYGDAVRRLQNAASFAQSSDLTGTSTQLQGRLIFALAESGAREEASKLAHALLAGSAPELSKDPLWNLGAGSATGYLARVAVLDKQYDDARSYYLRAMEFRRGANDPVGMWMAKMGEATTFYFAGQLSEAEAAFAEAARELHELGYRVGAAQAQVNLAETKLGLQKYQEALELLVEPEATLRAVRSYGSLVELLRCRVMASNALGHSEDAATALSNALRLATEHELEHALPALHALEKGA